MTDGTGCLIRSEGSKWARFVGFFGQCFLDTWLDGKAPDTLIRELMAASSIVAYCLDTRTTGMFWEADRIGGQIVNVQNGHEMMILGGSLRVMKTISLSRYSILVIAFTVVFSTLG